MPADVGTHEECVFIKEEYIIKEENDDVNFFDNKIKDISIPVNNNYEESNNEMFSISSLTESSLKECPRSRSTTYGFFFRVPIKEHAHNKECARIVEKINTIIYEPCNFSWCMPAISKRMIGLVMIVVPTICCVGESRISLCLSYFHFCVKQCLRQIMKNSQE